MPEKVPQENNPFMQNEILGRHYHIDFVTQLAGEYKMIGQAISVNRLPEDTIAETANMPIRDVEQHVDEIAVAWERYFEENEDQVLPEEAERIFFRRLPDGLRDVAILGKGNLPVSAIARRIDRAEKSVLRKFESIQALREKHL